ncbi:hypothetical protein DNTS_028622 [Danionella cerebrum]|uniref:Serine/threonine-protein phosphatase 2A 55 kDa regulatory subunit B n=1 Tax=Danionella cerebrum TaxID=2873325 RepID=A0A553MUA0_9TELE|nr:hypothetical protein DNTS_028622 [Danionella translucida]
MVHHATLTSPARLGLQLAEEATELMELMDEPLGLRFIPDGVVVIFRTVVFALAGVVEGKPIRVTLCTGANRPYLGWHWKYLMAHKSFMKHLLQIALQQRAELNIVAKETLYTFIFEEPEDPSSRSFFSEIISSISDVKFSHSGRYMMTRDYLSVKVWDLNMENRPVETYQVHEYLRSKLCSLYENDCIFDKFECCWNGSDSAIMTGSYNNFFRMFDRNTRRDITLEASRENSKPRAILKPRKVCTGGKRKKDEISVDSLDFNKKILHTAWHPKENVIAVAATNNLYIFQDKLN